MGVGGVVFHERSVTSDVSEHGCQFTLQRKLSPGEQVSIALVDADSGLPEWDNVQPFEVIWVEASDFGWSIGARKLLQHTIWPLT